jgi:hypothetical protein
MSAADVDPYVCEKCGATGKVVDSRKEPGYRRRRHECVCGERWTSYHSRVHPRAVLEQRAAAALVNETPVPAIAAAQEPARPAPALSATGQAVAKPRVSRVARSSYLGR